MIERRWTQALHLWASLFKDSTRLFIYVISHFDRVCSRHQIPLDKGSKYFTVQILQVNLYQADGRARFLKQVQLEEKKSEIGNRLDFIHRRENR